MEERGKDKGKQASTVEFFHRASDISLAPGRIMYDSKYPALSASKMRLSTFLCIVFSGKVLSLSTSRSLHIVWFPCKPRASSIMTAVRQVSFVEYRAKIGDEQRTCTRLYLQDHPQSHQGCHQFWMYPEWWLTKSANVHTSRISVSNPLG